MNVVVKVDGKVAYIDRTFKLSEAFEILAITAEEGLIPPGKETSVTITGSDVVIEGEFSEVKTPTVVYETPVDEVDNAEERPAVDVFKEGQACAV